MLELVRTKRTHPRLLERMATHYSQPKGFVGRVLSYAVMHDGSYYGHIIGGSACRNLPGRHEYLDTNDAQLRNIVSNIFFNVSPIGGRYPMRNFTTQVVRLWRSYVTMDWGGQYGDEVLGFETLIELPRTGELYRRDGWVEVGMTKGLTCKRVSDRIEGDAGDGYKTSGRDSWSGRRVWNTTDLRPKRVLVRKAG